MGTFIWNGRVKEIIFRGIFFEIKRGNKKNNTITVIVFEKE